MKRQAVMLCALSMGWITTLVGDGVSPPKGQEVVSKKSVEDRIKEARIFVSQITQDNKEVLNLVSALEKDLLKAYREGALDDAEFDLILEGMEFASDRHKEQTRKNKEKSPYITHPLLVTRILLEQGHVGDARVIVASLLHDTVRDGVATQEEIEKRFGSVVSKYVAELSEDKDVPRTERKRRQILDATHQSAGAAQIRLADQLCNLQELRLNPPEDWTRARVDEYYQWAQTVIDRLPPSNNELKKAASDLISEYWHEQEATTKH